MKKTLFNRIIAVMLVLVCTGSAAVPFALTASAASQTGAGILGGGVINGNDGSSTIVSTQFLHDEYIDSWLRDLIVKEDITTINSLSKRCTLEPVTDYPYTHTPDSFKSEVDQYIELYTLDDDSRKAAYIYLFKQFDSLSVISEPNVTNADKIAWLGAHGVVVPDTTLTNPSEMLMAGALYSLMRNDLYYVYTGKHVTIPEGTPMEEALMLYLMAFSSNSGGSDGSDGGSTVNADIRAFISKYFGNLSIDDLDKYVYYTALFALFTRGLVSVSELTTIPREEVYRRLAIMSITDAGISIDASTATTEELRLKYLAAMLSECYEITIDPNTLQSSLNSGTVHLYLVRLMAHQDAGLTISDKYSYTEAFSMLIKNTDRFALDDDFYSDIYEYNIHLETRRSAVYVRPTAIRTADSESGTELSIALADGTEIINDSYSNPLKITNKVPQVYKLRVTYTRADGTTSRTTYRLNIYQGAGDPPTEVAITDIVSIVFTGIGDIVFPEDESTTNPDNSDAPREGVGSLSNLLSLPEQLLAIANRAADAGLGPAVSVINGEGTSASGNMYESYFNDLLPAGYEYATDSSGKLIIIPIADFSPSTSTNPADEGYVGTVIRFDNTDIILASVALLCIIAFAALIISKQQAKNRRTRSKRRNKKRKKKLNLREYIKSRQRRV